MCAERGSSSEVPELRNISSYLTSEHEKMDASLNDLNFKLKWFHEMSCTDWEVFAENYSTHSGLNCECDGDDLSQYH